MRNIYILIGLIALLGIAYFYANTRNVTPEPNPNPLPPTPNIVETHRIIFFTQDGCLPCERLKTDFESKNELYNLISKQSDGTTLFTIESVDITKRLQMVKWRSFGVKSTPTLIVLPPKEDDVLYKKVGYAGDYRALSEEILNAVQ